MIQLGKQSQLTNRLGVADKLESELVYPLDKGYNYICQVDKHWLMFHTCGMDIANKYVVEINGRLYVNHDGNYWMIEKES